MWYYVIKFDSLHNVFSQISWAGTYDFGEDGGKTAGGTAIFIKHELEVTDGGDGMIARLTSKGYQTSTDLNCTTKVQGNKLLIYFDSYGESNIFEPYSKGDLLLTLERKTLSGKQKILTWWGAFGPSIEKHEKTGREYFKRSQTIDTRTK